MDGKVDRMTPTDSAERPPPADKTVAPVAGKSGTLADATASLAPFHTHFAHRPEWQAAADDEADAERDRGRGG